MSSTNKLLWLTVFGIAFALVEAVVVVYLRTLYYPQGFSFPPELIPSDILRTEVIREAATLVMLVAAGMLAGKTQLARFSAFLIVFGIWDVFYYVWLRVFLDWPATLFDWDVLFLIPGPWTAPVLAPLLVCIGFIGCGGWVFVREERGNGLKVRMVDWIVEFAAGGVIVLSFLINDGTSMPDAFAWWIFLVGLLGGVGYFLWQVIK